MNITFDTDHALNSLRPTSDWTRVDDDITWLDPSTSPPSRSEIDAEVVRLQAEHDAAQYQRDRADVYPPIGDQLDMQYHDLIDGTTTWKDHVAAVKAAHPKP